jgi:septum formation protein
MFITNKKIILASGSPRRQAYLNDMGIDFKVLPADIDETPMADELPRSYVTRMARHKALMVMEKNFDTWVVSADTIVTLGDKIFGKPKNVDDAVNTLMLLNGREHEVVTAFCIGLKVESALHEESVVTKVRFASFAEDIARAYASTGESYDKAGAYGIQGRGAFLVSGVDGSYSNVVGLPLCEVIAALQKHQIVEVG